MFLKVFHLGRGAEKRNGVGRRTRGEDGGERTRCRRRGDEEGVFLVGLGCFIWEK